MTGRTNAGGGIQLPALTNPAAAGNIQSGYQAINGEGEVVMGTAAVKKTVPITVTNSTSLQIMTAYPGIDVDVYGKPVPEGLDTTFNVLTNTFIAFWSPANRTFAVIGGYEIVSTGDCWLVRVTQTENDLVITQ